MLLIWDFSENLSLKDMKLLDIDNIVLASGSTRRIELLKDLGIKFSVFTTEIQETYPEDMNPEEIPLYLAGKKLDFALMHFKGQEKIIIASDTVVISGNGILEKPIDKNDAYEKLAELGGKKHCVITGVCIGDNQKKICFSERTEVFVEPLSMEEILYYIDNYSVMDKAGAYGIQEWFGLVKISSISGSYTNVMGLPTQKMWKVLNEFI
ncbi:MAG: Maf family nucleotide pyrophosphatase [Deltaproteobacteria bacterium]